MRCEHVSYPLPAFPVYSLGFVDEKKIIVGGGGGAGRSGIKNKLRLYSIDSKKADLVDELELEPNEDAPMTLAVNRAAAEVVCGINSTTEKLKVGENQNCRVYSVKDDVIKFQRSTQTLRPTEDADDYQKVTSFSEDMSVLAVGCTTNEVAILSYPSLDPLCTPFQTPKEGGDVFDIQFLDGDVVVTASKAIYFLSLPSTSSEGNKSAEAKIKPKKDKLTGESDSRQSVTVTETIEASSLASVVGSGTVPTFRSAKFGKIKKGKELLQSLFVVVNTTPPRTSRGAARKSYVCNYTRGEKGWVLGKSRVVSSKSVTVFDVSGHGKWLAYGSSDLSVGVLDSQTLAPLLNILNAHEFPPTTLSFNEKATLLVSGSADNSIRVIELPEGFGAQGASTMMYIVLALLIVLVALYLQQQSLS